MNKNFFGVLILLVGLMFVPLVVLGQVNQTPTYNPTNTLVLNKPIKPGAIGPNVVLLQGFLAKQGLMPSNLLTGTYGPVTKKAVITFQKLAGLTADGVVGSNTLFFMQNIMYPGLVLKDASPATLAHLQNLYQESKKAGTNKTNANAKQVLTQMLSVTPLTLTNKVSSVPQGNTNTILAPKAVTQVPLNVSTTQKTTLNTNNLKTFGTSQKQYSCTFTGQYTQICVPVSQVVANTTAANSNVTSGAGVSISQPVNQSSPSIAGNTAQGTVQPSFTLLGQNNGVPVANTSSSTASTTPSAANGPLYWYCTDPSCSTLGATTTPWWQSYNVSTNPEIVNACVPLSGYDIKLKLTAEDLFSVYAYKEDSMGKVTEMVPVCKDMKTSVYGIPGWKTIESCKKFKLTPEQHLAVVVADDGKIAEGWIGRLEIVGNVYFSQDFAWEHIISKTALPKTFTDFPVTQLIQEMNTGLWKPTQILGPMGIDPWGIFSDDTSLDDASWVKVQDPGLGKFSVFRLKNCGMATPASSVDLKVNGTESTVINFGASAEIEWSVANVSSCTATSSPANSQWAGSKSVNGGSVTISNINQNTTFTISCNSDAGTITDSVQVVVKPTVDLKVNNQNSISVAHDSVVNLSWVSSATTSCVASGGTVEWEDSNNASGQINTTGTFTTAPLPAHETFEFTITCTGPGGQATDTVEVEVGPTPSVLLNASASTVNAGQNVTLTWTPKFVTSCTATSNPGNIGWTGNKSVTNGTTVISALTTSTVFSINCTDSFNEQVSASVTVDVLGGGGNGPASVMLSTNRIVVDLTSTTKTATISWVISGVSNLNTCTRTGAWSGATGATSGSFTKSFTTPGVSTFTLSCGNVSGSVVVEAANTQTLKVLADATSVAAGGPVKLMWGSAALPSGKKCKRTNSTTPAIISGTDQFTIVNTGWNDSAFTAAQSGMAIVYVPSSNTAYTYTVTCEKDTSGGTVAASVLVNGIAPSLESPKIVKEFGSLPLSGTDMNVEITWSELLKTIPEMTSGGQLCIEMTESTTNQGIGTLCTIGSFPKYHAKVSFFGQITGTVPTQDFQARGTILPNGIDFVSWASDIAPEFSTNDFLVTRY